jgi:hypothetical protein
MPIFCNVGNFILKSYRYSLDFGFSFTVVQDAIHFSFLAWGVSILLKVTSDSGSALIAATA